MIIATTARAIVICARQGYWLCVQRNFDYLQLPTHGGILAGVIEVLNLVLNWQHVGAPEYLITLASDFRKILIRVVKGR